MWLLKIRIQLYKNRETRSFTAKSYRADSDTVYFIDIDNEKHLFLCREIRKMKVISFRDMGKLKYSDLRKGRFNYGDLQTYN